MAKRVWTERIPYLRWLMNYAGLDDSDIPIRVQYMLNDLFRVEFVPVNPMDINRAKNGLVLREYYIDIQKNVIVSSIPSDMDCTVLEMLIRLAFDISDMTEGFVKDASPRYWVLEMLKNNGLYYNRDYSIEDLKNPELFRGDSLFPGVKKGNKDGEIWQKMMGYLVSNFNYV